MFKDIRTETQAQQFIITATRISDNKPVSLIYKKEYIEQPDDNSLQIRITYKSDGCHDLMAHLTASDTLNLSNFWWAPPQDPNWINYKVCFTPISV